MTHFFDGKPGLALLISGLILCLSHAGTPQANADWKTEWDKTLKLGEQEGELTFYSSSAYEQVFRHFQMKFPRIRVKSWTGRGSQNGARIMAERRAGKQFADLWINGIVTANRVLHRARILDPMRPALILPEVLDQSQWWQGKHHYSDKDNRYIFVFQGNVHGGENAYNTRLIDPKQFDSYWDFLDRQWKGKILAFDPKQVSTVAHSMRFFYNNPELGPKFVDRFLGEADLVYSRDNRQMVDWLGVGKFPLAFFIGGVEEAARKGLPIKDFEPTSFKEGAFVGPTLGAVALFNRAPHPHAAKIAINWLLSREGQMAFQRVRLESGQPDESMREDIPKDAIPLENRRVKGGHYLFSGRADWIMGRSELTKVLNRAMRGKR